jgi:uncharacterized membrane protein YdjX (TVP38/TMEM64 family)
MIEAKEKISLIRDLIIIAGSITIGIILAKLGFIDIILKIFETPMAAAFVAGIFFTSLFTIAPASIVLAELGTRAFPLEIALYAALGAVVGDMLLFYFVKDKISADIAVLIKRGMNHYHLDRIHSRYGRWILPAIGACIIASPLPDELGIMLMGAAQMKTRNLIPISFVMNFLGVLLVIAAGDIVSRF